MRTLFAARGGRTLSERGQSEDDEQANELEAGKVQALKITRNAVGRSPQQADGSGMSHVTRMGPTPAPTQILSAVVLHFLRLVGKETVSVPATRRTVRRRFSAKPAGLQWG